MVGIAARVNSQPESHQLQLQDGDHREGGGQQVPHRHLVGAVTIPCCQAAVEFELEGKPLDVLDGEGLVLETPQRRSHWESFEPPIFVERPGLGAYLSSPFEIEGRATIFEGTV